MEGEASQVRLPRAGLAVHLKPASPVKHSSPRPWVSACIPFETGSKVAGDRTDQRLRYCESRLVIHESFTKTSNRPHSGAAQYSAHNCGVQTRRRV
jgi:hypothetical protein